MNILHMLDSLCEASLLAKSQPAVAKAEGTSSMPSLYVDYVSKDLSKIVEAVVPVGREGLPNLMNTKQVRTYGKYHTRTHSLTSTFSHRSLRVGEQNA